MFYFPVERNFHLLGWALVGSTISPFVWKSWIFLESSSNDSWVFKLNRMNMHDFLVIPRVSYSTMLRYITFSWTFWVTSIYTTCFQHKAMLKILKYKKTDGIHMIFRNVTITNFDILKYIFIPFLKIASRDIFRKYKI